MSVVRSLLAEIHVHTYNTSICIICRREELIRGRFSLSSIAGMRSMRQVVVPDELIIEVSC